MNPGGGGESMISAAYLRSTSQIEIKPFQPNSTRQSKVTLEYLNPLSFANFHFIITYPEKRLQFTKIWSLLLVRGSWKAVYTTSEPESVIVNRSSGLNLSVTICRLFKDTRIHTEHKLACSNTMIKGPEICYSMKNRYSCLSEQRLFVNATRFFALITVVDIAKLPTVP